MKYKVTLYLEANTPRKWIPDVIFTSRRGHS